MDIQKLMKQAQKMQGNIKKAEEELLQKEYEGVAGGTAVKVKIKGSHEVFEIEVEDDLVDKENKEVLLDLIMIAMNQAIEKSETEREEVMGNLTGGVKIPGF